MVDGRISEKSLCLLGLLLPLSFLTGQDLRAAVTVAPERFALAGAYEGRQLVVTAAQDGRNCRDLTREARYSVEPSGVVRVTPEGYVRPVGEGEATITVEAARQKCSVHVVVHDLGDERPLHFANDIVPLLTRYGC